MSFLREGEKRYPEYAAGFKAAADTFQARHDNMDALASAQMARDGYALGKAYLAIASVTVGGTGGVVLGAVDTALAIKDGEFTQDQGVLDMLASVAARKTSVLAKAAGEVAEAAGRQSDDVATARADSIDGRSQHYFDVSGKKGAWNKKLNQKLEANADYHINGYKFSTDHLGRVSSVEGRLTITKAERATYQQQVAGGADRLPDDQGGHLIASIFNGPGEAVNLKAMNAKFNQIEFRNLERTLADAVASGKKVDVKVDVVHPGNKLRPDKFIVEYKIDGVKDVESFRNRVGGK